MRPAWMSTFWTEYTKLSNATTRKANIHSYSHTWEALRCATFLLAVTKQYVAPRPAAQRNASEPEHSTQKSVSQIENTTMSSSHMGMPLTVK